LKTKQYVYLIAFFLFYSSLPFIFLYLKLVDSNYIFGIYENISQLLIIGTIILIRKKQLISKINYKILLFTFASALIADFIYMITIVDPDRESLLVVYFLEVFYIFFFGGLLLFLYVNLKKQMLANKITLTFTIIISVILTFLYLKFNLIPLFIRIPEPSLFYKISCTISSLLEVGIASLAITAVIRTLNKKDLLFLQVIILMCLGDFAIRYETTLVSYDSRLSGAEYVWALSMSFYFFVLFFYKNIPTLSLRESAPNWSIRTVLSFFVFLGLLLLLVLLEFIGLSPINNAYSLSKVLLVTFLVWFVVNFAALEISNRLLELNFKVNTDTKNIKFKPLYIKTSLYEAKQILTRYNKLTDKANLIHNELVSKSKLATIGQTTSMLAHDLRKPFTSVQTLLNMFEAFKESPSTLEKAKKDIKKSISNVESMIKDLMDFSREVDLSTKPTSLNKLIDHSLKEIAIEFEDVDISLKYDFKAKQKPLLDETRFSRVLSNIIGNALEAIIIIGESYEGEVAFSTKDIILDNKNFVSLTISNSGPTIDENEMPKIFDLFYTKDKGKGTGLGLPSAKKIVDLHGGEIISRNKEFNDGVEFEIIIPASSDFETSNESDLASNLSDSVSVMDVEVEELIMELSKKGREYNILLLEDEALYRASVRNMIRSSKELSKIITLYDVHSVKDAIDIVNHEDISHAIVDIDLGMSKDGFDFISEVNEIDKSIKVMIHSNRSIDDYKERAEKIGVRKFTPKPLSIGDMITFLLG
jgi:signal transduction histidine kinase/ActR/RegA family two-component response regulator